MQAEWIVRLCLVSLRHTCKFLCQVQAAFRGTGGNKTSVSEGVEASIIYVRFKAAASEVIPFDFLPMLVQNVRVTRLDKRTIKISFCSMSILGLWYWDDDMAIFSFLWHWTLKNYWSSLNLYWRKSRVGQQERNMFKSLQNATDYTVNNGSRLWVHFWNTIWF